MKMKRILSLALAAMMLLAVMPATAENKLWTEELTADGWMKVTNQGGATLGYSPNSGLKLVEADGYAFKDLNGNGKLDTYEDWRLDYTERARALAESGELTKEFQMGMKMNPFSIGTAAKDEIQDATKVALDLGYRHVRFPNGSADIVVGWNNMIQEYIESKGGVVIPATYIADPLGGGSVTQWPGYLGLAASFDPDLAATYGETLAKEWRALGITMKVAPQMDLATEPRWKRVDSTFGEDPQLSMDFSRAIVNAWQSTYAEDGTDLGWGEHSVNTQVKHLWGEGAAEGGRESHSLDGAYNVYPGGNQWTHLLPFLATLDLPGLTKATSSAMTNFSIGVDAYGDSIGGERIATSYNEWKINTVWRAANNWDGYILTDFNVHVDKCFGAEDMTTAERLLQILVAGCDAWGNLGGKREEDIAVAMEAYNLGVELYGQEGMDKILTDSTRHVLQTLFNVGIVDQPYLDLAVAKAVPNNAEHTALAFDAQKKSVVMVKNTDGLIKAATDEKLTVYIPWVYTPEVEGWRGVTPASWDPCVDIQTAMKYFNVVTDKAGAKSGTGSDGKPTWTETDIVRATAEEIASCDFALIRIQSPQNANPTTGYDENMQVPADYIYRPISLQYRPYTADNMYVRFESIGGQITAREVEGVYGPETVYEKENRSYYGQTGLISNEGDLDLVLNTAAMCDKVVVCIDAKTPMVFSEFESEVDAILMAWSGDRAPDIDDAAFLEIVAGITEPSGLLPMQMPANMETVEAQYEDVPRDMECHVDADGNTYDFAYGMNWSGVINDERVAKYYVDPIVGEDITLK